MFETNQPEDWVTDCNVGESELVPISFPEVFPVLLFRGGGRIFHSESFLIWMNDGG